jgi:hypothetical protein
MMKKIIFLFSVLISFGLTAQKKHMDKPFTQDYAVIFELSENTVNSNLWSVSSSRDKAISIVSSNGLLQPWDKKIVKDIRYRPFENMKVISTVNYKDQIVYLTDKAVLSNDFAGKLYMDHGMKNPTHFAMGNDFKALVAGNGQVKLLQNDKKIWSKSINGFKPVEVVFDKGNNRFLILTKQEVYQLNSGNKFSKVYSGKDLTAITIFEKNIIIGTTNGILTLNGKTLKAGKIDQKLPWTEITSIENINDQLWFNNRKF